MILGLTESLSSIKKWAPDGDMSAPIFIILLTYNLKNKMKTKMKPLLLPKILRIEGEQLCAFQ